jgi:hypothetical protein
MNIVCFGHNGQRGGEGAFILFSSVELDLNSRNPVLTRLSS